MTTHSSIRKCLVTGINTDKKHLIRFVIDPKKNLIADIEQTLPGRGYWVQAEREIILKALKNKVFFKAISDKITIQLNLLDIIEKQIKQKLINQISLSRKAGKAIFGFDKIKSILASKTINLLIQANDGSIKEKKRIVVKSIPQIIDNCLSGSELGKIFGKDWVVHCAILDAKISEKMIFNANRLNNLKNPLPH